MEEEKLKRERNKVISFKRDFFKWYGGEVFRKSEKERFELIQRFSKETGTSIPESIFYNAERDAERDSQRIERNSLFKQFQKEHPGLKYENYEIYKLWMCEYFPDVKPMTGLEFKISLGMLRCNLNSP